MKLRVWTLICAGILLPAVGASAQDTRVVMDAETDVADTALLDRPAQLFLRDGTLGTALMRLSEASGVPVAFSPSLVGGESRRVECDCEAATVKEALERLLEGTSFGYRELRGEVLVFQKAPAAVHSSQYARFAMKMEPILFRDSVTTAATQVATIMGHVTDAGTGEPLRGANIRLEGTQRGSMAGADGRYILTEVPAGTHTLVASLLGYSSQSRVVEVAAETTVTFDFALEVSALRLDEILVTATGEQRRREVANAIGRIAADSVVGRKPVRSVADLLTGRIPGVQILSHSGYAGQGPRIRIRGLNSNVVSNQPIIVIDGVRVEQTATDFRGSTGGLIGPPVNRLADLEHNDIESMEVVKGPSAATLYGTDAANGVIVIRTRRGRAGRTSWKVFLEQNVNQITAEFPDNYYSWGRTVADDRPTQCLLTQIAAGGCVQDSLTHVNPLMESASTPFATGYRTNVGMQVSGGVDRLRYFFSGNVDRDNGVLKTPAAEIERVREERGVSLSYNQTRPNQVFKGSLRGNVSAVLSPEADVTVSTSFLRNDTRIPDANRVVVGGFYGQGYRDSPNFWQGGAGSPGDGWTNDAVESTNRTTLSLAPSWRPREWLATRATIGGDFISTFVDALRPRGFGTDGQRYNERIGIDLYTVDVGATLTVPLSGAFSSRTSFGGQYNRRKFGLTSVLASNLLPGSQTSVGAATMTPREQNLVSAVAGAYVEETIGWQDRIFMTAAVRSDAGGAFGRDFKAAYYPKLGGTWLLSEERFLAGARGWLDELRLRAAYGASGVQPDPTAALALATPVTAFVDGQSRPGATLTAFGNPGLKPERQTEIEAGLDVTLLSGRIQLEATYYTRTSTDALVLRPFAPSLGFASRQENLGSVRNRGWEGQLEVRAFETPAMALDLSFNGSINENRVLEVGPGQDPRQINRPLFAMFSRTIASYEDANGDGLLGLDEIEFTDDEVYVGEPNPPRQLTGQATLTLFSGRVSISTLIDHRGGHVIRDFGTLARCLGFLNCRGINDPTAPLDEQAEAIASRVIGFAYQNPTKGDFTRWRELSAVIDLPGQLVSPFGARSGSLMLAGRNLGLLGGFSGVDPEMFGLNYSDAPSFFAVVPPVRTWAIRLNLEF